MGSDDREEEQGKRGAGYGHTGAAGDESPTASTPPSQGPGAVAMSQPSPSSMKRGIPAEGEIEW